MACHGEIAAASSRTRANEQTSSSCDTMDNTVSGMKTGDEMPFYEEEEVGWRWTAPAVGCAQLTYGARPPLSARLRVSTTVGSSNMGGAPGLVISPRSTCHAPPSSLLLGVDGPEPMAARHVQRHGGPGKTSSAQAAGGGCLQSSRGVARLR